MITLEIVESAYREFRTRNEIPVSPQSLRLITEVLNAIETDPHPRWRATELERKRVAEGFVERLPALFLEVARVDRGEVITTFAILHWLGRNLDDICPIKKD
jgi:hypothetical protein